MEREESLHCRKRTESDAGRGGEEGKVAKILAMASEEEIEEMEVESTEKLQFEERMVEEMMRWLEAEITSPSLSPSPATSSGGGTSPFYFQGAAFVTINGNEESCGPSFSDSATTVMASVDTRGLLAPAASLFGGPAAAPLFWPWTETAAGATTVDGEAAVAEDEEEWLARVLGGPGFEAEEESLLLA